MRQATDGRRRILLVINNLGPAGAESQVMHLAIGLAARGHSVTIACQKGAKVSIDSVRAAGVRVVMFWATTPLAKLRMLPALIGLARRADVVHCTMWDPSLWGRLAAIVARRPVVVSEHSASRAIVKSRKGRSRERWIALHNRLLSPLTYATVACAESQLPTLLAEGVDAKRIIHIPNGIPVRELERRARDGVTRAELGIPDGALVVLQIARFQPMKNQRATLAMVRRLRAELGDIHAVFAGDGPLMAEIEAECEAEGATWAHFLGIRPDVPALLAISDLCVLPSLAEAMPMSIIEAQALGVPVLATAVGDVAGVLARTGGGVVVAPGDDDALTSAGRELLSDAALRRRLGETGRRVSREQFDSEWMVQRYAQLLEAAAERRPLPVGSATARAAGA